MSSLLLAVRPLQALLAGLLLAILADLLADLRRGGWRLERGDYWTRVGRRLCIVFGPLILLSTMLAAPWLPDFFREIYTEGWHLHFDLVPSTVPEQLLHARQALWIPLGAFVMLLVIGLIERPADREESRWLAGTTGFGRTRGWLWMCVVPLAAVLALTYDNLDGGEDAYPAATWGTVAVLALALVGVIFSAGRPQPVTAPPRRRAVPRSWPETLRGRGIALTTAASWPAGEPARQVHGMTAYELELYLRSLNAVGVAPELVEAADRLLAPGPSGTARNTLVEAPEECGQVEIVAALATLLAQRYHEKTLIVAPDEGDRLTARLRRFLPEPEAAQTFALTGDMPLEAPIWILGATTLSERFLPHLSNPTVVQRVGLVVWWDLHRYTGVLGANMWAVSRRLHRFLRHQGRLDVRTLALVRRASHGGAQQTRFVERLLPHSFPPETRVYVEQRFAKAVDVHVLEGHQGYFQSGAGNHLPERSRHLPLVAAKISAEEGFSTQLSVPDEVTDFERDIVLQSDVGGEKLSERLGAAPNEVEAHVRPLAVADALSLTDLISYGAAATELTRHHVGLILPDNPYVRYLITAELSRHAGVFPGFGASQRLLAAEGHPRILQHHLLLALNEFKDTQSGLMADFLLAGELIETTLEQIAREVKLHRRVVRFLGEDGLLVIEPRYTSLLPPGDFEKRSLDSVGTRLVDVRDVAAGHDAQGVRMRLDPERLTIQAYPHRVFQHDNQRYRIRGWSSVEEAVARREITCEREDAAVRTWRRRTVTLYGFEPLGPTTRLGAGKALLTGQAMDLTYKEKVTGALRLVRDLTAGTDQPGIVRLDQPIGQSFTTRAMILRLPFEPQRLELESLTRALSDLLPVHLGVEEDALDVLPLHGQRIGAETVHGLAVVDLYPYGIGLVDAIVDDDTLFLDLLGRTRDWLDRCPCHSGDGCDLCLRSQVALELYRGGTPPRRQSALDLLRQVL